MYRFYKLYSQYIENILHPVEDFTPINLLQVNLLQGVENSKYTKHPQGAEDLLVEIKAILNPYLIKFIGCQGNSRIGVRVVSTSWNFLSIHAILCAKVRIVCIPSISRLTSPLSRP